MFIEKFYFRPDKALEANLTDVTSMEYLLASEEFIIFILLIVYI